MTDNSALEKLHYHSAGGVKKSRNLSGGGGMETSRIFSNFAQKTLKLLKKISQCALHILYFSVHICVFICPVETLNMYINKTILLYNYDLLL